jgi:hypothetical protein
MKEGLKSVLVSLMALTIAVAITGVASAKSDSLNQNAPTLMRIADNSSGLVDKSSNLDTNTNKNRNTNTNKNRNTNANKNKNSPSSINSELAY